MGVSRMALRAVTKTRSKDEIEIAPEPVNQRKQPEERYRLQVDRQTKQSFAALEPAEAMGRSIKTAHPIVQVSIYDAVDCTNTMIEADAKA